MYVCIFRKLTNKVYTHKVYIIYIYPHSNTQTRTHTYIRIHTHVYTHTHIYTYTYKHIYTCIHTHTCTLYTTQCVHCTLYNVRIVHIMRTLYNVTNNY